jgi:hypothetical protein
MASGMAETGLTSASSGAIFLQLCWARPHLRRRMGSSPGILLSARRVCAAPASFSATGAPDDRDHIAGRIIGGRRQKSTLTEPVSISR